LLCKEKGQKKKFFGKRGGTHGWKVKAGPSTRHRLTAPARKKRKGRKFFKGKTERKNRFPSKKVTDALAKRWKVKKKKKKKNLKKKKLESASRQHRPVNQSREKKKAKKPKPRPHCKKKKKGNPRKNAERKDRVGTAIGKKGGRRIPGGLNGGHASSGLKESLSKQQMYHRDKNRKESPKKIKTLERTTSK